MRFVDDHEIEVPGAKNTPTVDDLKILTNRAAALGADIFKVATTTENAAQLTTLINWLAAD